VEGVCTQDILAVRNVRSLCCSADAGRVIYVG
jgi:hypothetical protein